MSGNANGWNKERLLNHMKRSNLHYL